MPAVQAVNSFLELLEQSELLSADEIQTAREQYRLDERPSAKHVARKLLKEKLITRYQAERLLAGRTRGFRIDHYQVLDILGFGGMGRIYIAKDCETGKRVALKVLTEHLQVDAGMIERMRLEAQGGMRLDHENVVRTFEMGNTGAVRYMVMELVEGISLHEVVSRNGPLPPERACDIIAQAAMGLQHAHERRLVHRDVKPGNLLVSADGTTKILDFGLALDQDDADAEFSLAMIFGHECLGTADYISPEQSLSSHEVDGRADVYSLGCTMYFALTGKVPFSEYGSPSEKIAAQRTRPPRAIQYHQPDVPKDISGVVAKMLAKEPQLRYQTAAEVAEALRPFAERGHIPFDFERILRARARSAAKRAKQHQQNRTGSSSATGVAQSSITGGVVPGSSLLASSLSAASTRKIRDEESQVEITDPPESVPVSQDDTQASSTSAPDAVTATMLAAEASLTSGVDDSGFVFKPLAGGPDITLPGKRILIGRAANCDLRIDAPGVSSRHCELTFAGDMWHVEDLNSKNGIRVNGKLIKGRMLIPGDELQIAGNQRFRLLRAGSEPTRSSKAKWIIAGILAALALWVALWKLF